MKIVSEAEINLETKEVTIGKHLDDYDFDNLDLEVLDREYVIIGDTEYPCCQEDEMSEDEFWYE